MDQKPSIGRIVHYVDGNQRCNAAIVTRASGVTGSIDLTIFRQDGEVEPIPAILLDTGRGVSTWHWPERA
jgi:hypothetical protein